MLNQFAKISAVIIAGMYLSGCSEPVKKEPVNKEAVEQSNAAHQHESHGSAHDIADNMESHAEHVHTDDASGHEGHQHGVLHLSQARVKPSVPGQKVSSAYFTLENHGAKDIEVLGITSNAADKTEFHTMSMENSKMVMRQLEKVVIPADGKLALAEGGDHVMLMQLKNSLSNGNKVTFKLSLDNGETFTITAPVVVHEANQASVEDSHAHHHHDM